MRSGFRQGHAREKALRACEEDGARDEGGGRARGDARDEDEQRDQREGGALHGRLMHGRILAGSHGLVPICGTSPRENPDVIDLRRNADNWDA
jgi:hypothetical protein